MGLITINEVARWLGLSTVTVWRRCRDGKLQFIKVDRALRFRPKDVKEYLNQHCQLKDEPAPKADADPKTDTDTTPKTSRKPKDK